METFYVPMYVQVWPTDQGLVRSARMVLRFDQMIRTFMLNVYCIKDDDTENPNPVTADYTIIEPHGNFAICKLDTSDGFIDQWKTTQRGRSALTDDSMISTSISGLKNRMKNIRNQWKAVFDGLNRPATDSETVRAINFLQDLDLSANHEGFAVLRDSYVNALADPATIDAPFKAHHWIGRAPFYAPRPLGPPLNIQVAKAMKNEMESVRQNDPIRTMHYALEYGSTSTILDAPVG